jgi:hypothetical protein
VLREIVDDDESGGSMTDIAEKWHAEGGEIPRFPNLDSVMDPAPELLDRLVTSFAPVAEKISTPELYWYPAHIHMWNELIGEQLDGDAVTTLREAAWIVYTTTYWSNVEYVALYGIPDAVTRHGFEPTKATEESFADLVGKLQERYDVLGGSDDDVFAFVPRVLRDFPGGAVYSSAYNGAGIAMWSEPGDLGQRPSHLEVRFGGPLRMTPRDFLRVDYPIPIPGWLQRCRTAYEISVRNHPEEYERVLRGEEGDADLRDLWKESFEFSAANWGSGSHSLDDWTQEFFDEQLFWGMTNTFGYEAVSLTAMKAMIEHDAELARRALRANTIHTVAWATAIPSYLDADYQLPEIQKIG